MCMLYQGQEWDEVSVNELYTMTNSGMDTFHGWTSVVNSLFITRTMVQEVHSYLQDITCLKSQSP